MVALLFSIYLSALNIIETLRGCQLETKPLSLGVYKSTALWEGGNLLFPRKPQNFIPGPSPLVLPGDSFEMLVLSPEPWPTDLDTLGVKPKNQCFKKHPADFELHYKMFHPLAVVSVGGLPSFLVINMNLNISAGFLHGDCKNAPMQDCFPML